VPLFFFACPVCGEADRLLLTPAGSRAPQKCRKTKDCEGTLKRTPKAPSMVHKEVIDNGVMARAVERDIDGAKLSHDRASKDYRRGD
jgi:hypothetical protein